MKKVIRNIREKWNNESEWLKTFIAGELGILIILIGLFIVAIIQNMLYQEPIGVDIPVTQPTFGTPMGALVTLLFGLFIFFLIGAGTYTAWRLVKKRLKK